MRSRIIVTMGLCLGFIGTSATTTVAQPFRDKQASTLPRLPDDQIEGSICSYEISPKDGEPIEGRFRVEGDAVFQVAGGIKLPPLEKPQALIDKLASGEGAELTLPEPSGAKRIGDISFLKSNRIKIDFDDKEALVGMMVIWKKQKHESVYMGYFKPKTGRRYGAKQPVEVRITED